MNHTERRTRAEHADVLVVDDEADIRELIELSLLRMGLACDSAGSVQEARSLLGSRRYRLCLTDMRLPDGDGLELVEYIRTWHPDLPVAVITAFGSIETAIRALKLGAFDFLTKPVELKTLTELAGHALKLEAAAPVAGSARKLVGNSPALQQLRVQAAKLARNQAPVFIHGESGTGKELIARLIHDLGTRRNGPFVAVNCGAISPELMESEFFGHRKGSFTGAVADKEGLFQAASGGTLLLDEIGELPLAMQVKLLRAIQERAVRPVGAQAELPVDVRILSASNQDLAKLVASGRFRQDLYFRLDVITLRVPPLRERREDIPALCEHILGAIAGRDGGPQRRLSARALARLQQHGFPGNVRELENLLERACVLTDEVELDLADLGDPVRSVALADARPAGDEEEAGAVECERERVLETLERLRWNRSAAARSLGLTLRQLRYRLHKWGLE